AQMPDLATSDQGSAKFRIVRNKCLNLITFQLHLAEPMQNVPGKRTASILASRWRWHLVQGEFRDVSHGVVDDVARILASLNRTPGGTPGKCLIQDKDTFFNPGPELGQTPGRVDWQSGVTGFTLRFGSKDLFHHPGEIPGLEPAGHLVARFL